MKPTYDLRSDTITRPTEEMRQAMYRAEVGDDVYAEDPTINRLQDIAAEKTGKDAAIFLPSGSMGNLIPIFLNCGRGNELIAHEASHILHYEMTSLASIAGAMPVAVPGARGVFSRDAVEARIRPDIYYLPRNTMIEIESTHNLAGGSCWTLDEMRSISGFARERGLKLHLDGARIFNASVALGIPVVELCSTVDTVTFCLSKGLGAPVGSVLCGDAAFISEARRVRKLLGGGMRQAGVLAAAGIYALEHHIDRLAEDHEHASLIAKALEATAWAEIEAASVETNIIYFDTVGRSAESVVSSLADAGVRCGATAPHTVRMVTSLEIKSEGTTAVCEIIAAM